MPGQINRCRGTAIEPMAKRLLLFLLLATGLMFFPVQRMAAQEDEPKIHVEVDMVQLNVAVMDSKGNYVTGLRPSDFSVTEDGIPQKVATFGEGNGPTRRVTSIAEEDAPVDLARHIEKSVTQIHFTS